MATPPPPQLTGPTCIPHTFSLEGRRLPIILGVSEAIFVSYDYVILRGCHPRKNHVYLHYEILLNRSRITVDQTVFDLP